MDGKGPYRIYDPGGSESQAKEEASSYRQLLEENSVLRERMKGLKSLGDLLEESQTEASKLRKRVEELVRDNEALKSSTSSYASNVCMGAPVQTDTQGRVYVMTFKGFKVRQKLVYSVVYYKAVEPSSQFELVNMEDKTVTETQTENTELASQLQRLESSFSVFAEESNPNQLLAHLGRMAVEFHHLSSKVQKNEQRTSLLQTLCEQLRQENNELRKKMEEDLQYRNRDLEQLRQENLKLREQVNGKTEAVQTESPESKEEPKEEATKAKLEMAMTQQAGKTVEKTPSKTLDPEVYEKKIRLLEKQRRDVLEVNKQWDIQWNSMKAQFEQKITDLRQRLADSQKAVLELEAEREQRQRDYDKKLLLAKSKIDNVQVTPPLELLSVLQNFTPTPPVTIITALTLHNNTRQSRQALVLNTVRTVFYFSVYLCVLQVKIFEEDFRKERSDRERMNEEKEDLRRQVERLQGQMTNLTNQLHQAQNECQRERAERCKLERLQMQHNKQGQPERRTSDPTSTAPNGPLSPPYCGPFVQVGHQGLEGWPIHFPPRMPTLSTAPGRDFQPVNPGFPWQSSFPQPRGSRGQPDPARAPPENAEAGAAGFGKRDRQNAADPGKH
uniref:TNFAIP3 interacting protein 1 n=1 Tax=Astyanax mexicanus TaxID=7994 RepID=A0A8B9KKD0_ASTMX